MPEYNPDSGPEPKRRYRRGWWILPAFLAFLFICVILIALLLPHVHTSASAFQAVVIALLLSCIGAVVTVIVAR